MIGLLILTAVLLVPMHPGHTEVCYWKDRHKAHCAEGFYLSEKRPAAYVEVLIGKGESCDARGCPND